MNSFRFRLHSKRTKRVRQFGPDSEPRLLQSGESGPIFFFSVCRLDITECDEGRIVAERNRTHNGHGFDSAVFDRYYSGGPFCFVKFTSEIRALIHFRPGRNTSRLIQIQLIFHYPDIQFFL